MGRGARISRELSSEGYDRFYQDFDSPLMQRIRREAYGDDIGQYSWVTKQDLESDVARLGLTAASRILDLGCGPGGPFAFVVGLTGCQGTGIDTSFPAINAARKRGESLGLEARLNFQQADLNQPLAFPNASFDAAISFDVVLHVRDRTALFREIRRVLIPGGKFLFTDAGVVTGLISADQFHVRAGRGFTKFVVPGLNEQGLTDAGFEVLDVIDRTPGLAETAGGRLRARSSHESELKDIESQADFEREQRFLEVVVELAQRRALSRMLYSARAGTS
jgi:SAM-dependent methyltransferase